MESRRPDEDGSSREALEFVRYCYRRRRSGWPELYDEMCLVASRGFYRGWGFAELGERGIGFSLFETTRLAGLVAQVSSEEAERRPRALAGALGRGLRPAASSSEPVVERDDRGQSEPDSAAFLVPIAAGAH